MNRANYDRRESEMINDMTAATKQSSASNDPVHSAPPTKPLPKGGGFRTPRHRTINKGHRVLGVFLAGALATLIAQGAYAQQSNSDPAAIGNTQTESNAVGQTQPPGQATLGNDALDSQTPNALNNQPSDNASALQEDRNNAARERSVIGDSNRYQQPRVLDDNRRIGDELGPMPAPLDREVQDDRPMNRAADRGELGVFLIDSSGPGVRIRGVVSGSAAEAAGLESGDVILSVDGEEVMAPSQVAERIRNRAAGDQATLVIWRDGNQADVAATLQAPRNREYRVGFRGDATMNESASMNDRTRELERRLDMVMQELERLRAEVRQLQGAGTSGASDTSPMPQATPTLREGDSGGLGGETESVPSSNAAPPNSAPSSVPSTLPPTSAPDSAAPGQSTLPTTTPATSDPLFE